PVPYWVFTALAAAFAVALVVFAFWGEYTRRERVEGFLALDAGAARLLASDAGTVVELLVKEGDEVEAGAPIARISLDRATAAGTTSELVQRELQQQQQSLESELQSARLLAGQQADQLRGRMATLRAEIEQSDSEIQLQTTRVASARDEVTRTEKLVADKFLSESALIQKRNDLLEQQVKLQTLRRQRAALERDLLSVRAELAAVDLKLRQQIDQLERKRSELQTSRVQQEARRETVVRAPIAGTVTNIAVARGESVAAEATLATILPKGSGLRAHLLVPTRAAGFIQPGNEVVLRYDAFPFQRFGQYRGVVEAVSRTVWSPGEKVGPMTAREPVYRVDVKLESQTVRAGGQEMPLKPGMTLGADILLEKRTVFEWVFEPVLELRSRLL
ncbi:MAG: HlyD family secretion protein, partial [Burkholderiaceae bacterium]|nr:HlyD family secretion protein [Burkholderiaceae bacterium]